MSTVFRIPNPHRHWGCRVNDAIVYEGMRALIIQNEIIQVIILVDKGGEIIQFLHKPSDTDFLWHGPNPLHNPSGYPTTGAENPTAFFDHYSGGWIEVAPNGGPACVYKGAPLGFYGDTTNVPWHYQILEDTPSKVSIAMWVETYRTPFLLRRMVTIESGNPALFFEESLTNTGFEKMDFMWGHHPVLGSPFIKETCQIFAPDCRVEVLHDEDGPDYRFGLHQVGRWPYIKDRDGAPLDLRQIPSATGKTMDNCYLSEYKTGWIAVNDPMTKVGFGLAWDAEVFRYCWIWEALGGGMGYPWYGRTNNLGIEPWTGFPCGGLNEAISRKTNMSLNPGESLDAWLTAVAFSEKEAVNIIERDGMVK